MSHNWLNEESIKYDRALWDRLKHEVINPFKRRYPDHPVFKTGNTPKTYRLKDCMITGLNGNIIGIVPNNTNEGGKECPVTK